MRRFRSSSLDAARLPWLSGDAALDDGADLRSMYSLWCHPQQPGSLDTVELERDRDSTDSGVAGRDGGTMNPAGNVSNCGVAGVILQYMDAI